MKRYVIEKEEGLGCFNLIIWEFIFTIVIIFFNFKHYITSIHPIVGLLLGFTCAIVLVLLMNKPIIGTIIHIILGGAWGIFFYSIANSFFQWSTNDMVWNIFFIIVFCIIGISLHFASHKDMKNDQEIEDYTTSKTTTTTENINEYYQWYKQQKQQNQEKKQEYDNNKESSREFNPFAGCNTKEQVKIRYKQLMKSFHPDLDMGDEETAKFLNNEYERLMKQYN